MRTIEATRLVWRKHRLSMPGSDGLVRVLAHPATMLARAEAGPVAEATGAEQAADGQIELPELPDDPLLKAVTLLHVAAQVEHALMVQYLYAGYSFAPTQSDVVNVAVEEM